MENPDSIAFSDTIKYYTPGGKVVYGGGGIMPDVYVALKTDENDRLYNRLIHQNLIFQYAFDYTDKERATLQHFKTVEDFRIISRSMTAFITDYLIMPAARELLIHSAGIR